MFASKSPVVVFLLFTGFADKASADEFISVGSMVTPRLEHTSTLLNSGKVLIAGGQGDDGSGNTPSAEVYDPSTMTFTRTSGQMNTIRTGQQAVKLQDGRVLIVGGGNIFLDPPSPAEIYDPLTDTFSETGTPIVERYDFNAELLPDGRVIIAGGEGCCKDFSNGARQNIALDSVEIFDPTTQQFSAANPLSSPRGYAASAVLDDGRFILTGGKYDTYSGDNFIGTTYLDSADVFNFTSMQFEPASGSMTVARSNHSAATLPNGQILVSFSSYSSGGSALPVSAEKFNPVSGMFSASASPPSDRVLNNVSATLGDGRILFAGGYDPAAGTTASAMLYAPSDDSYSISEAVMSTPRNFHRLTALNDGTVLITGGWDTHFVNLSSAELFIPSVTSNDTIFSDGFDFVSTR